ncbi:hypothetical protein MXMO3_03606 (plasmid) [Maritalea myrionectae]|uniref:Uncharacterized protein n=1 Tax=Maritalea myrionectae TaxID=454601 RepID=A0A2R4MJE5_9HYPH|nr:hypothetical protein [Maritalea myrionectae]AVX06109.1 hypothetical protein MXMO3_03606 [Maritalea myrionectae]
MRLSSSFFHFALASLGALCLSMPATAQMQRNVIGTVEAQIGDRAYSGETIEVPSEGTATATATMIGPVKTISIQAHNPNAEKLLEDVVNLNFTLMGEDAAGSIIDATISFWPEGMGAPFYTSQFGENRANVTLETLSFDADMGTARGNFSGNVCRQDSFSTPPDPHDCHTIEGTFDTALKIKK